MVITIGAWTAGFAHATPVASGAESCANEARRVEQTTALLPDCRAYELVTPPDKDSGEPKAVPAGFETPGLEGIEGARAATDGDRIAWVSEYPLPGSQSPGQDYLSTREEDGWSSENVVPRQSVESGLLCPELVGMVGWSPDLLEGVLADGYGQESPGESFLGESLECGHDEPRLVAGEPEGFQNLFLRDSDTGSYQLVNVTTSGVNPPKASSSGGEQYFPASFLAGSANFSHVVFEEELALTPEAPSGDDLYEWAGGVVRLVTILPDGQPVQGSLAGATRNTQLEAATSTFVPLNLADARYAVSGDGSRIFFQADGNLYVRENGTRTVQIDASHGPGPGGGGEFMAASESGSIVFFLDGASAGLTPNTVEGSGVNLYEDNLESGTLVDLTPGTEAVVDGVSGASENGSYVYFVAEGALAAHASAGQPNLYLYHGGALTFIATLSAQSDSCDWATDTGCLPESPADPGTSGSTARVSANGQFIGFASARGLTGYDNADAASGEPDDEVFLYDATTNTLSCASCDPSGAAPTAPAIIRYPALPDTDAETRDAYPQRNVSDDGQVFFETASALLPRDTNGQRDVYEYEEGRLYLISSGSSDADSYFLDAGVNGANVFFATAQQLLARDDDAAYDIYDARVGGGFPEPPPPAQPCGSDEGCRGPTPGTSLFSAPTSALFVGGGNPIVGAQGAAATKRGTSKRAQRRGKRADGCTVKEIKKCAVKRKKSHKQRRKAHRKAKRRPTGKRHGASVKRSVRRGPGRLP